MIFDTHTHYDDEAYDADRDELISSLPAGGVGKVCNIGASFRGAVDSLALAKRYAHVYAAVGVHPDGLFPFGPAGGDSVAVMQPDPVHIVLIRHG